MSDFKQSSSAYRAAYHRAGAANSGGRPSAPAGGSNNANAALQQQPLPEEPQGYDTWSGFLSSELGSPKRNGDARSSPVPCSAPAITQADMLSALTAAIGRQNAVSEELQSRTAQLRRDEEQANQKNLAGGKKPELANMLVGSFLQDLLAESREQWVALLSERVAAVREGRHTEDPRYGGLPTSEELLGCIVGGMNSTATRGRFDKHRIHYDTHGIDGLGACTLFAPHVQSLTQFSTSVPTLEQLRDQFRRLDPAVLSAGKNPTIILESSLAQAEAQLDTLLRGDGTAPIDILLDSTHPSLRRLVYPRALGLKLSVTDGKPPFPAQGAELVVNRLAEGLPAYLTCGTKYARDKVRRRLHHSYSTAIQESNAKAVLGMFRGDVNYYVGDSDKYFVYTDDVDVLGVSMLGDRSMPDTKFSGALQQMGRPSSAMEAYIVYLHSKEGDLIQRKAPPSGFFPVAASSLLIAPVCNITGDTVEQYELATAMWAQMWVRLQGPTPEMLQCCLIFERLLSRFAMDACVHAMRVLQASPLRMAVDWMLSGFTDVLDPYEVLSLWDWMLAFNSLEMQKRSALSSPVGLMATRTQSSSPIKSDAAPCALWLLPIFAASLFIFRAPLIMKCRSKEELEALFTAGHHLQCRPLIQSLLFTDLLGKGTA